MVTIRYISLFQIHSAVFIAVFRYICSLQCLRTGTVQAPQEQGGWTVLLGIQALRAVPHARPCFSQVCRRCSCKSISSSLSFTELVHIWLLHYTSWLHQRSGSYRKCWARLATGACAPVARLNYHRLAMLRVYTTLHVLKWCRWCCNTSDLVESICC